MEIFAWCIMTNHMHLIFRSTGEQKPESLLGDFKRFTSKEVVDAIKENPRESRRELFLDQFKKAAAKSSNVKENQFWRHDNKPIELWSNKVIFEKLNYVNNNLAKRFHETKASNPVEAGFVTEPHYWKHSSAANYCGEDAAFEIDLLI